MDKNQSETIKFIIKNKRLFSRALSLMALVVGGIILVQNVSCGYSKTTGFWFKWVPAASISIDKKL